MRIQGRITLTSNLLIAVTVAAIVVTILVQRVSLEREVTAELDVLTRDQLAAVARDVTTMCRIQQEATQQTLAYDVQVAHELVRSMGTVELQPESRATPAVTWAATDQLTNQTLSVSLPRMAVGGTWLGQNADPTVASPVVDKMRTLMGVVCTVFQRMNDQGDFLRVATNVMAKTGTRAIGTFIPHKNADGTQNAVVASLLRGERYVGRAYVVDAWYESAYEPLKDSTGRVIGALFVGFKEDPAGTLRTAIIDMELGKTGYVYVLGGTGDHRGAYIISKDGARDGESLWEAKDASGHLFIQSIVRKGLALKDGGVDYERYPWQNAGEAAPRWKLAAVTYFAPWDWVIGAGAYEDEFQAATVRVGASIVRLLAWSTGMAAALLAIAVAVSLLTARGIAKPLCAVTEAAGRMALGDFSFSMKHKGADEVGDMVRAFTTMAEAQDRKAHVADRIAHGDLTCDAVAASDRDTAGTALDEMTRRLNDVMGQIRVAVAQVSAGADQVAQSSQSLSQGASQQAASLEEVTSALAEISGQSERTAQGAQGVNALAKTAVESAQQGNAQMTKLVEAMAKIDASTQEITKIVKLIDDIAFQINLLALNANVEAARAGKYGKGFAVVAEEVRNLAVRSAAAVKDTTRIVQEATRGVGEGAQVAEATAKHLEQIVHNASKVADFLSEIAIASKEQAQGVGQVNTGLSQVGEVTQANTASAEQSAAASEELSAQAQHLRSLVDSFKLKAEARGEESAAEAAAAANRRQQLTA